MSTIYQIWEIRFIIQNISSDLYEIQRMDNLEKDHHLYVRTKNNNFEFQF